MDESYASDDGSALGVARFVRHCNLALESEVYMSYGHLHKGLLKAIVDVVRAGDPCLPFSTIDVTEQLLRQRWWGGRSPKTPERTVNIGLTGIQRSAVHGQVRL